MLSEYPTIQEALDRADRTAQDLPHVVQVRASDWDTVVLSNELRRLQHRVTQLTLKRNANECITRQD